MHLNRKRSTEDAKQDRTRKLILKREQETPVCSICGLDTWLGRPILLILDHINGNADDNGRENLRLVCSNCDATLPTYKSRNNGNGRAFRRVWK